MPRANVPGLPQVSPELRIKLKEDIRNQGYPRSDSHRPRTASALTGGFAWRLQRSFVSRHRHPQNRDRAELRTAERADLRLVLNLNRRQLTQVQIRELVA